MKWLGYIVAVAAIDIVDENSATHTECQTSKKPFFHSVSIERISHCATNALHSQNSCLKFIFRVFPLNFWLLRSYYCKELTYKRYHVSHTHKTACVWDKLCAPTTIRASFFHPLEMESEVCGKKQRNEWTRTASGAFISLRMLEIYRARIFSIEKVIFGVEFLLRGFNLNMMMTQFNFYYHAFWTLCFSQWMW